MITVRYFYSACVSIDTPDVRILCDPWFTEGAYDGSWYQYPRLAAPLEVIGACDWIYISHLHPDHYDPTFVRAYLGRYPAARVLIAPFRDPALSRTMTSDGIPHQIVEGVLQAGHTTLRCFPNDGPPPRNIDSAVAVRHGGHAVVNMNDNLWNARQVAAIRAWCAPEVTIALLGYTGAGPYPQTYYNVYREADLVRAEALAKKQEGFRRYTEMATALHARLRIPFAGQYVLGGARWRLNPFRGLADATEVLGFDPRAVVLADGGTGAVDTETLQPTATRTVPYGDAAIQDYARSTAANPMRYTRYFSGLPLAAIPWGRLLPAAAIHARARSRCTTPHWFCVRLPDQEWFAMSVLEPRARFTRDVADLVPRSEITIDPHYLFGLVTGVFLWNHAEVGSQYVTRRIGEGFRPEVQGFLHHFRVGAA